jgi:hypothetical protein
VKTESCKSRMIDSEVSRDLYFIQLGYRVCCMALGVWFDWRAICTNFVSHFSLALLVYSYH